MADIPGTAGAPLPPDFDIFNQDFSLIDANGQLQTTDTSQVDLVRMVAVRAAIVFATQMGASVILLLVLLLMTPAKKRRSLSWIFNVVALVFNVIRCTIQCVEMTGPFLNFVLVVLQEYSAMDLNKHARISVANAVISAFVFIFIELALVTQVQVICAASMAQLYRAAVLVFCGVVAALAISFRLYLMVVNSINIMNLTKGILEGEEETRRQNWAQKTANITAIVSICVFSAVFCAKLAVAIRSRRKLGLKQFGAMQIVFIMGCQTLIIPVIFAILDYYALRGAQLGSVVETLVAIFLPLSSMWATTNVKSKNIAMPLNEKGNHRAIPVGHSDFGTGAGSSYSGSRKPFMDDSTIDTLVNRTPNSSFNKSPTNKQEAHNEPRVSVTAGHRLSFLTDKDEDLEMGRFGNNIHVDKTYTVLSEPDTSVGRAR